VTASASRWRRVALVALAVVIVAAGAALANLQLLDAAGEDRLGHLRPVDAALSRGATDDTSAGAAPSATGTTAGEPLVEARGGRPDGDDRGARAPGRGGGADD
jgi:hypothetical protein